MAEGAPEPDLRNDGSLAGAADSAAPASPAVETSWNDQDWSQPWGWADWSWRGWQPYRWSWTGRYSYATTRPSGETQSGEQPRQSVGTTDRDAADPDGIPQEPARLDAPSSGPTMTPGTRFSTTSSNSGEASASSAVRPGTSTSERTVVPEDPWAQATRSNFSPPVPSAPPAASTTQWSSSGGWAQQWGWPGRDYGHRGDYADPPAWPGWSYRKQWTAAVRRWDKNTDVPVWKRALGWDLQTSFEHLTEAQLTTDKYLESILSIIELKAGVREDDERRFAFRSIMYDGGRKKDETLGQYAMRRIRDYNQAANHGIQIPDEFKATLLREGANISDQTQQNLTTLIQGRENDVDFVATSLARLDVRSDRLNGYVHGAAPDGNFLAGNGEGIVVDHDEASGSAEDDDEDLPEQFFTDLADLNMDEEQVSWVLATLDGRGFKKRRSWKENKKFKAEARKDRGSFVKGASGEAPRGQYGGVPGQLLSAPWKDASRGVEEDHEVSPLPQELVGGVPHATSEWRRWSSACLRLLLPWQRDLLPELLDYLLPDVGLRPPPVLLRDWSPDFLRYLHDDPLSDGDSRHRRDSRYNWGDSPESPRV